MGRYDSQEGIDGVSTELTEFNIKTQMRAQLILLNAAVLWFLCSQRAHSDEKGNDVETSLCKYLKTSKFSIHLDESTVPNNESLLVAYDQFIKEEKFVKSYYLQKIWKPIQKKNQY